MALFSFFFSGHFVRGEQFALRDICFGQALKMSFVLSADFIRVQLSNLKTKMMQWKSHDIEVVAVNRLDKCTTNTLDTINKLS